MFGLLLRETRILFGGLCRGLGSLDGHLPRIRVGGRRGGLRCGLGSGLDFFWRGIWGRAWIGGRGCLRNLFLGRLGWGQVRESLPLGLWVFIWGDEIPFLLKKSVSVRSTPASKGFWVSCAGGLGRGSVSCAKMSIDFLGGCSVGRFS